MDHPEMAQRLALAAHRFVQLSEIAMRRERERIAFGGAQEAPEGGLQVLATAVEQSKPGVDVGIGRYDRRGAEQRPQRAREVAFAFEQAGEVYMGLEVSRLAAQQFATQRERA